MTTEKRRSRQGKSISTVRPRNYSDLYKNDNSIAAPVGLNTSPTSPVTSKTTTVDWSAEYGYVAKDLRQLLTVSAILFVLIIVASFIF
jgi:hypothetical protein